MRHLAQRALRANRPTVALGDSIQGVMLLAPAVLFKVTSDAHTNV